MPKKKWQKPELIVLVKGRPEEAVLANCKTAAATKWPDVAENTACDSTIALCSECKVVGNT